jgi:DUF2934 family protein
MNGKKDDRIRSRAYGIWEREGRPQGRHEHHWHEASREVDDETSDGRTTAPGAETSSDAAGSEEPHSNADARLSGNDAPTSPEAPAASAPVGKAAARAKRPAAPKARAKASAKPKA